MNTELIKSLYHAHKVADLWDAYTTERREKKLVGMGMTEAILHEMFGVVGMEIRMDREMEHMQPTCERPILIIQPEKDDRGRLRTRMYNNVKELSMNMAYPAAILTMGLGDVSFLHGDQLYSTPRIVDILINTRAQFKSDADAYRRYNDPQKAELYRRRANGCKMLCATIYSLLTEADQLKVAHYTRQVMTTQVEAVRKQGGTVIIANTDFFLYQGADNHNPPRGFNVDHVGTCLVKDCASYAINIKGAVRGAWRI
ncbi:hypothetical protein GR28A_00097 [Vibrio phage vB_VcorM_GR28A]|nr:hypothetical protein GR28A_00097 [Vibrio phage vB_VcorM_GR28A]